MNYEHSFDSESLRGQPADVQHEVMERWFRARFEDPAERTPYDSAEGGYMWIWGGPFEAEDQLRGEFEGVVPENIILSLSRDLEAECPYWAPVPSDDDYDHALLEVVESNAAPRDTLSEALGTIDRLLALARDDSLEEAMNRLLYANVITALETYLSDTFLRQVQSFNHVLRRFVETTPDFKKRSLPFSEVFQAAENARDEAKKYLLKLVWHNLAQVQAMYTDTLSVDMRPHVADVAKAIPKRHDIVHRNGRDQDGDPVTVSRSDVKELSAAVGRLADHIERELLPEF